MNLKKKEKLIIKKVLALIHQPPSLKTHNFFLKMKYKNNNKKNSI